MYRRKYFNVEFKYSNILLRKSGNIIMQEEINSRGDFTDVTFEYTTVISVGESDRLLSIQMPVYMSSLN